MATVPASVGFLNVLRSACPLLEGPPRDLRAHRGPRVSCEQRGGDQERQSSRLLLDRRDMLLGLGGLYGAGAAGQTALASPVMPPDITSTTSCHIATDPYLTDPELLSCCPPYQGKVDPPFNEYTFPRTALRVRRPAHLVANDKEYMEKYKEAVDMMKKLPESDPRNFNQQAKIHCAYCNNAYDQVDFKVPLQVHNSWLFFPWHRYYLHFYERILGKLIDDDTFALPFWNFDHPDGMQLPAIFTEQGSTLYNANRDTNHYPPAIVDYLYSYNNTSGSGLSGDVLKQNNLDIMRKTFNESKYLPQLFLGDAVRAGDDVQYGSHGQLEGIHNSFHQWVGQAEEPHRDMGSFATSGYDSAFYCVHANVDRLWNVYRNLRGNKVDFDDPDWLDATFVFYDEEGDVVTVKVRDSLSTSKFSYTYEEVPLPWLGKVPKKPVSKTKGQISLVPVGPFGSEPRALTEPIRVLVQRPKPNRSRDEKEDKAELLLVKNIQAGPSAARFDVYIAKPAYSGNLVGPDYGEFVGSFVKLISDHKGTAMKKTQLKLGITSVLDEIDAESADKLVVTLVPRDGDVTVGGLQIKLFLTDINTVTA